MDDPEALFAETLFKDLVSLEESSFPKKCETCGMVYHNVEEFTKKTVAVNDRSGFKSSEDDDGSTVVELFRNCECGSTLLDFFADRRDMSEQGEKRRQAFDRVLNHLVDNGIEVEVARKELRYYLKYKKSEMLEKLGVFQKRIKT